MKLTKLVYNKTYENKTADRYSFKNSTYIFCINIDDVARIDNSYIELDDSWVNNKVKEIYEWGNEYDSEKFNINDVQNHYYVFFIGKNYVAYYPDSIYSYPSEFIDGDEVLSISEYIIKNILE